MSQVQDKYKRDDGIETLSIEQLNYAREIIAKKRPMTDVHISKVWPYCKVCCMCCKQKPNFKLALKKSLLNKLDMKIPKSDIALDEDPFLQVGYGINAYFDVIGQLSWMFLFMSIILLPTMSIYSSYGGLKDRSIMYVLDQYTLGNMGGSHVLCDNAPLSVSAVQLSLSCSSGQLSTTAPSYNNDTPVFTYGIINSSQEEKNYCTNSAFEDSYSCTSFLNSQFAIDVASECNGKTSCNIGNLIGYIEFPEGTTDDQVNECYQGQAMVFIQMPCVFTDAEISQRQVHGLYNSCVGVFIALFMIVYVDYIRSIQASNFVEWDVKTITAGDYSVEFDITEAFYDAFVQAKGKLEDSDINEDVEFSWQDDKSDAENFRIWIQNQIEFRMSKLPDLGYNEIPPEHVEVAVTSLAYDNASLISLLRERGTYIMNENWDKMRKVDEKINSMKESEMKDWCRPCSVFITFKSEEGLQRALNFDETLSSEDNANLRFLNKWYDEEKIEIQQASEPSDIIWENRHFTPRERTKKAIIVGIVISLMLFVSFIVIFVAQKYSYALMEVYPPANCEAFEIYVDTLPQLATGEYAVNTKKKSAGQSVTYSGYLQCYCDNSVKESFTPTEYEGVNICTEYFNFAYIVLGVTNIITGFIVVVNTIIKGFAISLITWIGYDTHSEQLTKITNGVFISLFFNTGILLILTNANFSQYHLPLKNWFNGAYDDYSPGWYVYVANTLTQTMIINAFFQTFFQIAMDCLAWFFKRSDQRWTSSPASRMSTTKTTQVAQYVALFTGEAYIVHFKFSMVFNVVFVTMLYGLGIPLLFPIAVVALVIFWMLERYCVAYTYQKPPSLDDRLTKNAVSLLTVAPLLLLINGFWMMTNTQIFNGYVSQISAIGEHMETGHTVAQSLDVNQALPLFLITIAMFFIIILETYLHDTLKKFGFSLSSNEIEVDENLPEFYLAVKLSDADWMVAEQAYYSDEYTMKIVEQELADKMDSVGRPKKSIQGIAWYNVLANPDYSSAFNYIECSVPDRSNLIVDDDDDEGNDNEQSDTVQVALNLGVLNRKIAHDMPFGKGMMAYMRQFKQQSAVDQQAQDIQ